MTTEIDEIKSAVEAVQKGFHEFKKANDTKLESEVKGVKTEMTEKLAKLNEAIDKAEKSQKANEQILAALNRKSTRVGRDGRELPEDHDEACKAYNGFLRKGAVGQKEMREFEYEKKSMSVVSDADGGYTVTSDMSGRVTTRIYETSDIRSVAAVQTISTDALEGTIDVDQAVSGWVSETGARPATGTPQVGRWRIPTHEQYAMPSVTQKLLDDSAMDPESWLANKVADIFSRTENAAFVLGNGVGKPRGFLTYPSSSAINTPQGSIEQVASTAATSGTFSFDDLVTLEYKLKGWYRSRAVYGMARQTIGFARTLKDGFGQYLWQPSNQQGEPARLHGFAIQEFNDMPALASNALAIVLADFSTCYQIVDRIGIRVLRDPYTSKGNVLFYTTKRVGGDVVNFEGIKLLSAKT